MSLKDSFSGLEPRERRLLVVFTSLFVTMMVGGALWVLALTVGSARNEAELLHEAIDELRASQQVVRVRQIEREMVQRRYGRPAPPLAAFMESLARELELTIPESRDRAPVPHGKRYEERSTRIVLHKVDMLKLVRFMERLETAGFPLSILHLNIRKRGTEVDSFDVELIASAFDQKAPTKDEKPAKKVEPAAAEPEEEEG